MSLTIALDNWQHWQVATALLTKPRVARTLSTSAYTSITQVVADTQKGPAFFVVRSPTGVGSTLAPSDTLAAEHHRLAAKAQLAPALRYVRGDLGTLVMDYIAPPPKGSKDHTGPTSDKGPGLGVVTSQSLATLLNGIHAIAVTGQALDLQAQLGVYTQRALARGVPKEELVNPNHPGLQAAIMQLAADTPVLCHNDLHSGNVLPTHQQLVAIDWEYAGIGSAYFDIACAAQGFPGIDTQALIQLTLGEAFSPQLWRCAQAVYAATEWNWYQASGITKPTNCRFDAVVAHLAAVA